jgi:ribosome-interacting GTPase 1
VCRIAEIELEMSRTQKNKATEYHLGQLKAKLAKLRTELQEGKTKVFSCATSTALVLSDLKANHVGTKSLHRSHVVCRQGVCTEIESVCCADRGPR